MYYNTSFTHNVYNIYHRRRNKRQSSRADDVRWCIACWVLSCRLSIYTIRRLRSVRREGGGGGGGGLWVIELHELLLTVFIHCSLLTIYTIGWIACYLLQLDSCIVTNHIHYKSDLKLKIWIPESLIYIVFLVYPNSLKTIATWNIVDANFVISPFHKCINLDRDMILNLIYNVGIINMTSVSCGCHRLGPEWRGAHVQLFMTSLGVTFDYQYYLPLLRFLFCIETRVLSTW